jgi:peptide/nickel transport system substrate-binding protein
MLNKRGFLLTLSALAFTAVSQFALADDSKTLRVAMTLSDIPATAGSPDQGAEGERFAGITLYDTLIAWDLSDGTKPAELYGNLAASWLVDPSDQRKWTFKLRPNVKFHDGSPWNAQAAVWNFDKLLNKASPQFNERLAAQSGGYIADIVEYRALDELTLEVITKEPNALLPYSLTEIWFVSPTQWETVGKDWTEFSRHPSGTGPFKLDVLVPRERAEMVANKEYWNPARVPQFDRLVLLPVPDANARAAALLSGQVDWIEAPPIDALPRIKSAGFTVTSKAYPHIWPWMLNTTKNSPLADVRLRRALNLAVDREGIVNLLNGYAYTASGSVEPDNKWYGHPEFKIQYDPKAAAALLAEAGYGPDHKLSLNVVTSAGGSGMMNPLAMNEYIQQNLKDVGVDVEYEVLEWNALRARRNAGATAPDNLHTDAINSSWVSTDPYFGFVLMLESGMVAPKGINFGHINDPLIDELCKKLRTAFDPVERDVLMAKLHERFVDQAYWLFVAHDANPRAMSPRISGYVPAQSLYQDLATIRLD